MAYDCSYNPFDIVINFNRGCLAAVGKSTGAFRLIEDQFQDIKISEIAETLFVNESYFSKLFKEEFGLTPENYLIVRKIAEAKKYLEMGASVKEACFLSGFHNYSNFIRTFKNFEGYSPGNLEKLTDPL